MVRHSKLWEMECNGIPFPNIPCMPLFSLMYMPISSSITADKYCPFVSSVMRHDQELEHPSAAEVR